jgi:hypothetical protein
MKVGWGASDWIWWLKMAHGNNSVSDMLLYQTQAVRSTVSQHNTVHISTTTQSVAIQTAAIVSDFKRLGHRTSDHKSTSDDKLQT